MNLLNSYDLARRNLELAAIAFYLELTPELARESKDGMVMHVVQTAVNRLK